MNVKTISPVKLKQGNLFTKRAILIKEKKEKKIKEKSGLPFWRITASMIRCYKNCKKLFYYQYVHNPPLRLNKKAIQLLFGGAFHKGIEALYENKDPLQSFTEEFETTKGNIRDFDNAKYLANGEEGLRLMKVWKEQGPEINKKWGIDLNGKSEVAFKTWWRHPIDKTIGLPVAVTGRYDRITDSHQILEFKTSSKPYKQNDVDLLDQASVYVYSYFLEHKVWPDVYYIVFIKNRKTDPIQVLKTKRSKESIIRTYEMIDLILSDIKGRTERDFTYGEGFLHKFCECKLYEEMLLL